jgi:amino acid permease
MISSLLGVITVYIILIAASLDPVAKLVHHGFSLSKGYSTIVATGVCFPLVHFKHISGIVTYFNIVGVLALVATFFAVVIASSHIIATQDSGSDSEHIAWWDTNMKDLPITLGILIFSFAAHGTFPGQSCDGVIT